MKSLNCPLCLSTDYRVNRFFSNPEANIQICNCNECDHCFTLIESETDSSSLYSDEVYAIVDNRNSIFDRIQTLEYSKVIRSIDKLLSSVESHERKMLDFGSGKGKFLSLAKHGYAVKGIETSISRANFAREAYGLDISTDLYISGKINEGNFSAIVLFHVLEHLPKPTDLLNNLITDNLQKNGVLVLEVPNISSWQAKLAGKNWMHLDIPRHLSHFTKEKIFNISEACGLKVVKTSYFSLHLGIIGSLRAFMGLFGYKSNIIFDLKNFKKHGLSKRVGLLISVGLIIPIATLIELVACAFKSGGIVRVYCMKD